MKIKELEDEDKKTIENYASALHELETKYAQKIKDTYNENLLRNTVGSIFQEFKKKYSHKTSDEQKTISSFLASKEDVVNDVYELVKKHNESGKPEITIPTLSIQPNESGVYKYTFVSKLNIDSISQEYFYCSLLNTPTIRSRDGVLPASHLLFSKMQGNEVESVNTPTVRSWEVYSLFKKVLKKNTKLDFENMTSEKLKGCILYYPADQAQPLEALKQKIKEILDEDFSPRHSIIEQGMDRYKDLSAGFPNILFIVSK